MTRARRRGRPIAAILLLVASVAVLATVGPGVVDHVAHPGRYAISGRATLPPATYAAAVRARLGGAVPIATLTLPTGGAPAIVSAWPSTTLYLDPPTARVLDVVRTRDDDGVRPIAGAQSVASVIGRAAPYAGGGRLRRIEWPTERNPDWTLRFGEAGAVKVADDSGSARPARARAPGAAMALAGRWSAIGFAARVAIVALAAIGAILALVMLAQRRPAR